MKTVKSSASDPLAGLSPEEKRQLLAQLLAEKKRKTFPLSPAQQRLWFIDALQPGQTVYLIPATLRLGESPDPALLHRCLNDIVARHEILRTSFISEGGVPRQVIAPKLELPSLETNLGEFYKTPFDLSQAPLLRARLTREKDGSHLLHLVIHHIIADYWSLRVLLRELQHLYAAHQAGKEATLPPLAIQYLDYAVWQNEQSGHHQNELDYWKDQLAGMPPLLRLPTDFPRPSRPSFQGIRQPIHLPLTSTKALRQLALGESATLFSATLAALQALLFRHTGQEDFCIGSTVSNRDREETRNLIGLFVNNLAFRCQPKKDWSFRTWIKKTHATVVAGLSHQQVPFEQVVDALQIDRQLNHNPLFQVQFVLRTGEHQSVTKDSLLQLQPLEPEHTTSRFDLSLELAETPDGLRGFWEYSSDLFDPATLAGLGEHLQIFLEATTRRPDQSIASHSLLTEREKQLLTTLNDTALKIPAITLPELITRQVTLTPEAPALTFANRSLSYAELDARANQLAHHLQTKATGPIAICLPRSEHLVVSLLAILKCGAPYLPLDPSHPRERLETILSDARCTLCLTYGNKLDFTVENLEIIDLAGEKDLISHHPLAPPATTTSPDDLAYLIYTSGSTGRPKGVPITHRNLVNLLLSMAREPGLTADDTWLALTTIAFDIATLEIFLPLTVGAQVWIADEDCASDGPALNRLLEESQATVMQATPATWRLLLESAWPASSQLKILCGGEALDLPLAQQLLEKGRQVWNLYGPTETTIWSGALLLDDQKLAKGFVPIGGPIANTGFHILDENRNELPPGIAGELHLSGMGLSPGYHQRETLTAEKFFSQKGRRLYATGDRARLHRDGTLEFLGRLDHQIKLRGFRIELGEIENHLTTNPSIRAAVIDLHGEGDHQRLVAWVLNPDGNLTAEELRTDVRKTLPSYMVPADFILLESFPLNPNGKVDRKQLPQPGKSSQKKNTRPLTTPTEKQLAEIWQDLLDRPVTHAGEHFFEAGGHSLLVARMMARVRAEFEVEIPLRVAFESPHLSGLAKYIEKAAASTSDTIIHRPAESPLQLSHAQERQWVMAQLDPQTPAYQIPAALKVSGTFPTEKLSSALAQLCQRHEVLHTSYPADENGKATPVLLPPAAPEVRHLTPSGQGTNLRDELQKFASQPFDLPKAPLIRVALMQLAPDEHVILFVIPHLIGDAWSLRVLLRDFLALIQGETLQPLLLQYSDFAHHERQQDRKDGLAYWKTQLADAPLSLDLPRDFSLQNEPHPSAGEVRFSLTETETKALEKLSRDHNATLFMTLLAGLKTLLHRYTGQPDLIVGSPVGHRPNPVWEDVVGMFVNTLALRTRIDSSQSFSTILAEVRETVLAGFEHQDVPFEEIVSALQTNRDWNRSPIFQILFLWQADPTLPGSHGDLTLEPFALPKGAPKFDLTVALARDGDELQGSFEYRSDLFATETITAMVAAFKLLLHKIADNPDVPISSFTLGTAPLSASHPDSFSLGLHQLFEKQAAQTPESIAIHHESGSLSYHQLNHRSSQLAATLQERGIGPENAVGICLQRKPDLIIAIFAVLKAGGAYLPLDPAYPASRLSFILNDAKASLVITDDEALFSSNTDTLLISNFPPAKTPLQPVTFHPEQTAYLIYTSGSTGQPKGVVIEHRNATAFVQWARGVFSDDELRGVLASTSVCFDLSVFEIFVPLSTGGSLILAENALALSDLSHREKITLINTVPTAAAELIRSQSIPATARTFTIAGEPLGKELVRQLYGAMPHPEATVYNLYGPSEDTTYSTFCRTSRDETGVTTPIGRPVDHSQSYLLDQELNPVPHGMAGDLYLAGTGLARGYWNRPGLTASAFLPNPFSQDGLPLYHTGDRARLRPDGLLVFLGRSDRQVKLRGYRIELAEIEQALLRQPGIIDVVVALHDGSLAAWLVMENSVADLRPTLARELPGYMVPVFFIELPALPKLPNGKIDHANLPAPIIGTSNPALPLTSNEKTLAEIWQDLLQVPKVGRDENFFSLGGDSILALQVIARSRQVGIIFSAKDLFQHPTVAELSALAETSLAIAAANTIPSNQKITAPLTAIQKWFFAQPLEHPAHWNQTLLFEIREVMEIDHLQKAFVALNQEHPALRASFEKSDEGWKQWYQPHDPDISLTVISDHCDDPEQRITNVASSLQSGFQLNSGPLWKVVYFDLQTPTGSCRRLLLICHHLVIDGVSWRILLTDLQNAYQQSKRTDNITFSPASTSVPQWLKSFKKKEFTEVAAALPLPRDTTQNVPNLMGQARTVTLTLSTEETKKLLTKVPTQYRIQVEELLLTALSRTITDWTGQDEFALQLEGHGRDHEDNGIDLSRTIGWLTHLYPIVLPSHSRQDAADSLKVTKEALRTTPNSVLTHEIASPLPELRFNYLGQTDQLLGPDSLLGRATESTGMARHPDDPRDVIFELNALVSDHRLTVHWIYHPLLHTGETMNRLIEKLGHEIRFLCDFCLKEESGAGYTASEFPQMDFQPGELDDLLTELPEPFS